MQKPMDKTGNEPDLIILHAGWEMDIFTAADGSLGISVSRRHKDAAADDDASVVDIFVDKDLNVRSC